MTTVILLTAGFVLGKVLTMSTLTWVKNKIKGLGHEE